MEIAEPATDYDPYEAFAAFSAAMGAGVDDPHSMIAELRQTVPVMEADFRSMMGMMGGGIGGEGGTGAFLDQIEHSVVVFGFDEVQEVLRDGDTYSSKLYEHLMGPLMGHSILEMDEPEHHRYRALIQQAFTRKAMERWETASVRPVCDQLIDGFTTDGSADLVRQYTFYFPINVIASILGLPADDLPRFHRLAVELISGSFDQQVGMRASKELADYFGALVDARREDPADDLISLLVGAELDGQRLTDEEIFSVLRLLLPAGAETTFRSSGNLLFALLSDPAQLDAVRRDRTLLPTAIEEGIRWEPPLTSIMRTTTRPTTLGGVDLPEGAVVIAHMGSANRDERRWADGERFDLFRPQQAHLSFAFGPHMCLGMHLARMETRVAVEALLDRLDDLALAPDPDDPPRITGLGFRSPTALPVTFTAEG
jgi:cytochrome P450